VALAANARMLSHNDDGLGSPERQLPTYRSRRRRPVDFNSVTDAVMSMARPWRGQDKRKDRRELLATVCGSFTEGFDTLDLKEANALLGVLA